MKKWIFMSLLLICLFFLVPIVFVMLPEEKNPLDSLTTGEKDVSKPLTKEETSSSADPISVSVFRSETEAVEEIGLEEYVAGVVASEMPAEFEMEALKAQALTARTYIARQLLSPTDIDLPGDAVVTDTQMHQVYKSEEELREQWGDDFQWKMNRIQEAVLATQGQVLTYEGEPITAAFFSTSNGYTENAEDYWENPVPYLQSVESPWDQASPKYTSDNVLQEADVERLLGVSVAAGEEARIISRTESGRVQEVELGGKTFSGREVREKLELPSSDFEIARRDNEFVFTTKGYGHGIGMSQYGAEGMAQEGMNYQDIVRHYYQGVNISTL
ncbi:stage II sporulation protein D [Alteribacillus persepolensis]|uniref:Stage II sporulation protein D n=1 Tax=Alteribacillus persepolensis TaxID=568899 RepID=A0A1G8HB89_9BACI|nr:stage II sporulation protein D [Alteribacillus persepolensis]SDI03839.1 stage II sporulation protein D [Alteribacillus persepolensis]